MKFDFVNNIDLDEATKDGLLRNVFILGVVGLIVGIVCFVCMTLGDSFNVFTSSSEVMESYQNSTQDAMTSQEDTDILIYDYED